MQILLPGHALVSYPGPGHAPSQQPVPPRPGHAPVDATLAYPALKKIRTLSIDAERDGQTYRQGRSAANTVRQADIRTAQASRADGKQAADRRAVIKAHGQAVGKQAQRQAYRQTGMHVK